MPERKTTKQVIAEFKAVHGDLYDYSKVKYVRSGSPVTIICQKHGEFEQIPTNHKKGRGCLWCFGSAKSTKSKFIEIANVVHNNYYDYSKVEYVNAHICVTIICPIHGEFKQSPNGHKQGRGCSKCGHKQRADASKSDQKTFIKESNDFHNNKYDYSRVEYVDCHTLVTIVCPDHGEFKQSPSNHKGGNGCPKCGFNRTANARRGDNKTFEEESNAVHNNKYDYSKTEYSHNLTPVIIICPYHGEFEQSPNNHKRGKGCPKCATEKTSNAIRSDRESFIEGAKAVHGDRYDYSKVEYVNSNSPVTIICPDHGEFQQVAGAHKMGRGCFQCAGKSRGNREAFIEKANNIHGKKFDYSKVEYVNNRNLVTIICPDHGEFNQSPINHKRGAGCPKCGNTGGVGGYHEKWITENPKRAQYPGILYLIELWDDVETFFKVGVTMQSIDKRFSNLTKHEWDLIAARPGTIAEAIRWETQIKKDSRIIKKWPRQRGWDGWTECYRLESLDALGEYFPAN